MPQNTEEPVVLASFLIPFTVEKDLFGQYSIKKCFHNPTLMYGTLENMMQKKQYNFKWVGIISTIEALTPTERENLERKFQKINAFPIFITAVEL